MLKNNSSIPLYEQIKEYILHQIHQGDWTPHMRIPSERDLAESFGVSRMTVAKAIKELVHDGRLYVQIGKGTYINEAPMKQEIEALTSFTEDMASRGQVTNSRVLRAEIIHASNETAEMLDIFPETDLVLLERVRFAGGRPIAIERSTVIASLCPYILQNHDFSQESLYQVLREVYNVNLMWAQQTFEARAATESEAQNLHLDIGSPVLAIHRVTYNQQDVPCEEVKSVYRGDRYKFRAKLTRI